MAKGVQGMKRLESCSWDSEGGCGMRQACAGIAAADPEEVALSLRARVSLRVNGGKRSTLEDFFVGPCLPSLQPGRQWELHRGQ